MFSFVKGAVSLTTTFDTINDHHPLNFERLAEVDAPPAGSICRVIRMRTGSRGEVRVVVAVDGETSNTVAVAVGDTTGVIQTRTLGCCSSSKIQFDLHRISCREKISIFKFVVLVF